MMINKNIDLIMNKKASLLFVLSLLCIFTACKSTNAGDDLEGFNAIKEIVNNRNFEVSFRWAQPQKGGMIDLTSNPNEFSMNEDQADIYLPYFGVRHRGGAYNQNKGGISYQGNISNLQINEDVGRRNIVLSFEAKEDTEQLFFILTIFENGNTQVSVSSSDRDSILYQGGIIKATQNK